MEKTCTVCGKPFFAHRSNRMFCSKTCKHTAYLIRKGFQPNKTNWIVNDLNTDGFKLAKPGLLNMIEDNLKQYRNEAGTILNPLTITPVGWMNTRLTFILNQLLSFCYYPHVTRDKFRTLYYELTEIIAHPYFKQLPSDYPFRSLTVNIHSRVKTWASGFLPCKFIIPLEEKARIIAAIHLMNT